MTEMNSKNENSPICKDRETFTHNSNKKSPCSKNTSYFYDTFCRCFLLGYPPIRIAVNIEPL